MFNRFLFFIIFLISLNLLAQDKNLIYEFIEGESLNIENLDEDKELLFAEYCFFNTEDKDCYTEIEEEEEKEKEYIEDNEGDITSISKVEIFYTLKNAIIRSEPNTNSKKLLVVSKGKKVEVLKNAESNNIWYVIRYNNLYGYMHSSLLTKNKVENTWITKKDKKDDKSQWITPKDDDENNENITNKDTQLNNFINDCINDMDKENYTKENNKEWCVCFWSETYDLVTNEKVINYYDKYEKFPIDINNKLEDQIEYCYLKIDEKVNTRIKKEFIYSQINDCKSMYSNDFDISRKKYNNFCECKWPKFYEVLENENSDELSNYLDKYEKFPDNVQKKLEEIENYCINN